MEAESKKYTAFTTPDGAQYSFNVMPFGLKNAPSTFQKLMTTEVLAGMIQEFVQVYLDDIVVYSTTPEEHLTHLRKVLERLRLHNLKVSAEKCRFFREDVDYLGYHVRGAYVEPQKKHLEQIRKFPAPKTKRQLQSFIGTVNWLREHIPQISQLMAPLNELLKGKGKGFRWTPALNAAFEQVKAAAAEARVLSRPNFNLPFIVQTDASAIGMSAVLYQEVDDRRMVISYASAKFKDTERRYHVNEQECLALVWAVGMYRAYLEDKPFIVRTDSRALTWLHKFKDSKAKLTRWALTLQEYAFTLEHVPGTKNQLPDWLSRNPEDADYRAEPDNDRLIPPDQDPQEHASDIRVSQVNVGTMYEKIARAQTEVRQIRRTIAVLRLLENQEPETPAQRKLAAEFRVDENLLWRRNPHGDRLVVPRHLTTQLIHTYHDLEDQAHPGVAETNRRIGERYFWGWMLRDIQRYIKKCIPCSLTKPRRQDNAPLHARTPTRPFEMISVDLLGPYPEAIGTKNKYVIIMEDVFSKWVEAKPAREVRSRDVIQALEELITTRYGYPQVLVTDNARIFTGNTFRNYCTDHDIEQRHSSIYHQQANPVERRVQELKKVLRVLLLDVSKSRWEQKLPKALQVLRSRTNRATGKSPAELILGQRLACPGEWRTKWYRAKRTMTPRQRRRQNQEVFARQLDFQRREYHNPEPPTVEFQPGDRVNVRNFTPRAFAPVWTGPHEIVRRTGATTYEVLRDGNQENTHLNDLRPAPEGNRTTFEDEEPFAPSESSGEEYQFPEDNPEGSDADPEPEDPPGEHPGDDEPQPGPSRTVPADVEAEAMEARMEEPPPPLTPWTHSIADARADKARLYVIQARIHKLKKEVNLVRGQIGHPDHRRLRAALTSHQKAVEAIVPQLQDHIDQKRMQVLRMTDHWLARLDQSPR